MFRKPRNLLFIILLISAALRIFRLDVADGAPIFDEKNHYLEAVRAYLRGTDDTVPEHPPLGKELIALGMVFFGDNPWGWRVPSLVFSLVGIFLVYLLAEEILHEKDKREKKDQKDQDHPTTHYPLPTSLLSVLLLSVDSMYFIYSRLAVLDMFLTVFVLMSLLFLWRMYRDGRAINLMLLASSFGLALATKWTALHLVPVMAVFLWFRSRRIPRFLGMIATTILVASAVYAITYAPYFTRHPVRDFIGLNREILATWEQYDKDVTFTPVGYVATHAVGWILNPLRSYYTEVTADGKLRAVIGHFNPVLFWGALAWGVWGAWKRRFFRTPHAALFLLLPILSNVVPWFFVRRVQHLYYLLPSFPLAIILLSSGLRRPSQTNRDRATLFILIAIGIFLYDLPLLTGVPVSLQLLNPLIGDSFRLRIYEPTHFREFIFP